MITITIDLDSETQQNLLLPPNEPNDVGGFGEGCDEIRFDKKTNCWDFFDSSSPIGLQIII